MARTRRCKAFTQFRKPKTKRYQTELQRTNEELAEAGYKVRVRDKKKLVTSWDDIPHGTHEQTHTEGPG